MAAVTYHSCQNHFPVEVMSLLNESPQAKVLLGARNDSGKKVTVKIPYLDFEKYKRMRDTEILARAMDKILSFDHEHVVRHSHHEIGILKPFTPQHFSILDSQFNHIPQYQIVMEFCSGGTLHDRLKRSSLTASLLQKWASQLVKGLAYLHEQRFAHKDLKGDHIFLSSPDVETCTLKIGSLMNLKTLLPNTATSVYCGDITNKASSFAFMSPEMITGSEVELEPTGETRKLGRRSDIWSLGCVLIQMATRNPPRLFKQKENKMVPVTGELAVVYFVGSGGSPTIPSDISTSLKQLIEQCLARNPNDRPTAAALLQHPFFHCSMTETTKFVSPSQAG